MIAAACIGACALVLIVFDARRRIRRVRQMRTLVRLAAALELDRDVTVADLMLRARAADRAREVRP